MALDWKGGKAALSRGNVVFTTHSKDDYWLVNVKCGDEVVWPDDVKPDSEEGARLRAEEIYKDQWAALNLMDMVAASLDK